MAKKQTFAAVMKQLSNKKGSYEKGLEEARRVGNPSGIRDYERRLAKLSAGMDELFQTQQMMNGGATNLPKAEGGMQTINGGDGYKIQYVPMTKELWDMGRANGEGVARQKGPDGWRAAVMIYPDGTRQYLHANDTPMAFDAGRREVLFSKAKDNDANNVARTGDIVNLGNYKPVEETTNAAPAVKTGPRTVPADGSVPGAATNAAGEYMIMQDPKSGKEFYLTPKMMTNLENGAFGQFLNNGNYANDFIFVDEPAATPTSEVAADAAGDPVSTPPVQPTPRTTTTNQTPAADPMGTTALQQEQARRRAEDARLGLAGASATSGIDDAVFGTSGTGIQLPGLDTPAAPGALPGVFGIAEQLGAFNAPTKTTVENASGTDEVAAADKASSTTAKELIGKAGKAIGDLGLGGKGLGMALGAAAQFLPDLRSMKAMGDIEGPALMPTRNPVTMNTDIQTGRAIQDIRNQTALSNAAVDANISNPAVAAAAKRANQRVEQGQLGNVLFNEAQKENELRNQNLRQLQETQYGNQMTNYQNRMNQINFDNERIAAENRMRGQMSQKLGAAFGDFQNRAQDMKKWDLVRKLDQYGVIGRNNIDPTS